MQAIVYVSNTGYTKAYAELLSTRTGLPAMPLAEAVKQLPRNSQVIYLGWLMAGSVKDYRKAARRFDVRAICGVGLGDSGAQDAAARKACGVTADFPLFTLQGGMDLARLRGPYKLAIHLLTKGLAASKKRTPDDERMLQLLQQGGNYVSVENLAPVLNWFDAQR